MLDVFRYIPILSSCVLNLIKWLWYYVKFSNTWQKWILAPYSISEKKKIIRKNWKKKKNKNFFCFFYSCFRRQFLNFLSIVAKLNNDYERAHPFIVSPSRSTSVIVCLEKKTKQNIFLFCKPLYTQVSQIQLTWKIFLVLTAKLQLVML